MKDKLKILKLISDANSRIGIRRLDVLARTEYAEINSESLDLSIDLPSLLSEMKEEELISVDEKDGKYFITDIGLEYLKNNYKN